MAKKRAKKKPVRKSSIRKSPSTQDPSAIVELALREAEAWLEAVALHQASILKTIPVTPAQPAPAFTPLQERQAAAADDWFARQKREMDAKIAAVRPELLMTMRRLKVVTVSADYDGCGDSGQIEEPGCYTADNQAIVVNASILEQLRDFFYDLLEGEHPGWEINEGSYGGFSWDIASDKIQLDHNNRFESSEYEGSEL